MGKTVNGAVIELRPKPSWALAGGLALPHAVALLALVYTALPGWILSGLALLIILNGLYTICHHALRCSSKSLVYLRCHADGSWYGETLHGTAWTAHLQQENIALPAIIILRLREQQASRLRPAKTLLLTRRCEHPETLRRLRSYLRAHQPAKSLASHANGNPSRKTY